MGYEKDRMMQEQGWGFRDGHICYRCVTEPYLHEMVRGDASEYDCSFCGKSSRKAPISIPFNDLMEVIGGAISQYFDRAVNCLGYCSAEGGYLGTTYQSYDIVRDEIPTVSENEEVLDAIIDSLGDEIWCDQDPYSLSRLDSYNISWENFCKTVKHSIRYFFDSEDVSDEYSETIPVPRMLAELRDIIDRAGLISSLPLGTSFFRVRVHKPEEVCENWRPLGSPPAEAAVSGRMSAAGISVFYAALDMNTAKAETIASLDATDERIMTGAMWTNTRPLNVLDLSKLPKPPSFYAQARYDRDHLMFLREFVESITLPVQHDDREHIDYVPSQIVTEYFRHRYTLPDKSRLDAIVYPSAQHVRGRAIVIFASQDDLDPSPREWGGDHTPILKLDQASICSLRKSRRKH
jgi:hypothetical protein